MILMTTDNSPTDPVAKFVKHVRQHMEDEEKMLVAIEKAYDYYIVEDENGPSKDFFLSDLLKQDEDVFRITVNHLFTPIKWSKYSLRKGYIIKNTGTGNPVALVFDIDNGKGAEEPLNFALLDCGDPIELTPLYLAEFKEAEAFLQTVQLHQKLSQMQSDEGEDTTSTDLVLPGTEENDFVDVVLRIDDRINIKNLEIGEMRLIY